MQGEVKTMAAPAFIPLTAHAHLRTAPPYPRPTYQQKYQNANSYYNRTKRKRDSSSGSSSNTPLRGGSPGSILNIPPWVQPDNPYSKEPIIGLHEEINDFYQWITPTQEEHYMRLGVVGRIEACVKKIWPTAALHIFGSFRTGLYLPTSDIDLALFGKWETLPLRTLEKALLEDDIADPATLKVLDKASVPIIKMTDKRTRVRVDVSFNMVNGIKSVELVKMYKKKYPPLSKLIYVLKQFLLQRDLNEVFTGGLSSYCLILMVVSFLQLHARHDVGDDDANLGVLLLEFFELYGKSFDYQSLAIRVTGSGSYVPKEEIQEEMPPGSRPSLLCVEDPLQPGNDVGKSSYGALRVRQAFDYAYGLLDRALQGAVDGPTLLSTIIQVDPATVEYRDWIRTNFNIPQEVKDGSVSPVPEPEIAASSQKASAKESTDSAQSQANCSSMTPSTTPKRQTNNNNNNVELEAGVKTGEKVVVVDVDEALAEEEAENDVEDVEDEDEVIILEETEEEADDDDDDSDIPSSRPSSPEVIDLTREDDEDGDVEDGDNNSTTSSVTGGIAVPAGVGGELGDRRGSSSGNTPAMSISPVTSEAGDSQAPSHAAGAASSSSPATVRRASSNSGSVAHSVSGSSALSVPSTPGSTQSSSSGVASSASASTPPRTNATRASKPLYKPPVNRWSAGVANNKNKSAMTRADLDMNWRLSARGPGSDQSSNSGGETVSRRMDKADKDFNWRDNKPPSGSKSRKHADGKRDGGKKDENRQVNGHNHRVASSPAEKRGADSKSKSSELSNKNNYRNHHRSKQDNGNGGKSSGGGSGSKGKLPTAADISSSTGIIGGCESSSSSSSGIGSSRLSSGGSSDAVDSCAAVTAAANRGPARVPELHGGEAAAHIVGGGASKASSGSTAAKESLSRRGSGAISEAGKAASADQELLGGSLKQSKNKRKKRFDNGGVTSLTSKDNASRDSSPNVKGESDTVKSGGGGSSSSGNKSSVIQKNASNRFSREAGPRIPKR